LFFLRFISFDSFSGTYIREGTWGFQYGIDITKEMLYRHVIYWAAENGLVSVITQLVGKSEGRGEREKQRKRI
jgi:hypothetical protein